MSEATKIQKRSKGQPYLSWCLIVRNCEETLEACLQSLRERTPDAEIVVVDTCSSDRTPEIAKRYADVFEVYKGPRGTWDTEMPWFDDAAAARQRSFDLASGRWRAWADADDRVLGGEEAKQYLQLNKQWCPPNDKAQTVGDSTKPKGLEDVLKDLEKFNPDADCVWAPYLYQRDEHGHALVWQERERIVRWKEGRWRWAEKAHEILVPNGPFPPRVVFAHLLFLHEKKFTANDKIYSLARHYDVLSKMYEAGDRTSRRCQYLAEYAKVVDPAREEEYVEAMHTYATTVHDRYRALLARGNFYAERGLYNDAMEAYGAATTLEPSLPDAWFAGAAFCVRVNDTLRAIDWYEKGLACPPPSANPNSYISPRAFALEFPTRLAIELHKLGQAAAQTTQQEEARVLLERAVQTMGKVASDPDLGSDAHEARMRLIRFDNDYKAQRHALMLQQQADYLFDNDEPLKVRELLESVPWNLQDHPIVVGIERRVQPVIDHVEDEGKYEGFYQSLTETGAIDSPEAWLEPEHCVPRARWVAEWIDKHKPDARVLEVGPFDGIVAIPLLKMCPDIQYTGVELSSDARKRLQSRLEALGMDGRATVKPGKIEDYYWDGDMEEDAQDPIGKFDVVIWFEVIEHVPDPTQILWRLSQFMRDDESRIFVSTPWGAFDAGHPPAKNTYGHERDPRGHVRAMTPRDVVTVATESALHVQDLFKDAVPPTTVGDAMHVELSRELSYEPEDMAEPIRDTCFVVPGALWDWNSRTVHRDGMGASEETIVYLAKRLVADMKVPINVYGPVPNGEPDVHHGVAYWPRPHQRYITKDQRVVVSRSPLYGRFLDEMLGYKHEHKFLWLQDAIYPELNPEIAKLYEKIVVVSEWHKQAMHERHGVPLEQMEVAYNFLLPEHFQQPMPERKADHFVFASSPDRGVVQLLELWPRILKELPEATLDIYYGWRGCEVLGKGAGADGWTARFEQSRKRFEKLKHQQGVKHHGMVNHWEIARAYMRAGVWAYWTPFEETGCLSACKARAGGAVPVVAPVAALNETAKSDLTTYVPLDDEDGFIAACVAATRWSEEAREEMAQEALADFSLDAIMPVWRKILG